MEELDACNVTFSDAATEGPSSRVYHEPLFRIPTRVELRTLTHLAKRPAVDIAFQDLSFTVPSAAGKGGRRQILKSVSGQFRCGELTAIMGPSGAGKSSLMNILAGSLSVGVTGSIEMNGHPRQMHLFHKLSAYIQQEDLLQPRLTVLEAMRVAADLKLGDELNQEEKSAVVEEVLESLFLKVCRDTRTERLSGGQRKRLSIALELVNNPPVVFIDEPTTGLDIVTVKKCITMLKSLARQGRTIICTIHQPTSTLLAEFDNVYVIARGQCVYQGDSSQIVPFLGRMGLNCPTTYNPADYIMEIIQGEEPLDILRAMSVEIQNGKSREGDPEKESVGIQLNSLKKATTKLCRQDTMRTLPKVFSFSSKKDSSYNMHFPNSSYTQFKILLRRMALQSSRNKSIFFIMLLHHIFSGFVLGGIYFGSANNATKPFMNFKFCISVLVFFMYTHIMTQVLIFPTEVKLLQREYFNRWYGLKPYYMALTVSTLPTMILFGSIFLAISYLLSAQPLDILRFMKYSFICLLIGAVSEGYGLAIGSMFNVMNGSIMGPLTFSPLLILSVYGMGQTQIIERHMNLFMSLSYLRYGLVGIANTIYGDHRPLMECEEADFQYCHYQDPEMFLRDLGMGETHLGYQIGGLVAFLIFYRMVAYLALRFRLTVELSSKLRNVAAKILRRK